MASKVWAWVACAMGASLLFAGGAKAQQQGPDGTQKALGDYVPLHVDNFTGMDFRETTRAKYCVSVAWQEVERYRQAGATVEVVFQQEEYSLYKVVTRNNQRVIVHCNQNGSLVVGWKPDTDVANFVISTTAIGVSLREKEIDNQTPPAVIINNSAPAK